MLRDWVAAGFDPSDFWHRTPREVELCFEGAALRMERRSDLDKVLAWSIAALMRIPPTQRLPSLESLLSKAPTSRELVTPDEQWAFFKALAAMPSDRPH